MRIIWPIVRMLIPLSILALPVAFWLIKRSASKQEPFIHGAVLEFPLTRGMRFLIGFVLALLLAFTVLILFALISSGGSPFAVLIPLAVLLAITIATPAAVVVDDTGIRQRRWPLAERQTAWTEVATVTRGANTGRIFVWSTNGKIAAVFSPQLVGQQRFEHEIRARAKNVVFEYD
jgi:uncharacterized Tic20 family protein